MFSPPRLLLLHFLHNHAEQSCVFHRVGCIYVALNYVAKRCTQKLGMEGGRLNQTDFGKQSCMIITIETIYHIQVDSINWLIYYSVTAPSHQFSFKYCETGVGLFVFLFFFVFYLFDLGNSK